MSKCGYGLNAKQCLVLGYSGLRGAVSLTLALIVYLDHDVDHHIRDIVLFHTAGVALLTLIINGSTIGLLVKKLGMMRMSEVKKKMLKNLIKAYRNEAKEVVEELKEKRNFGKIDADKLIEVACTEKIRNEIFKRRAIKKDDNDLNSNEENQELVIDQREYTEDELYLEAKYRYLTTLKGIYWDFFEQGQ